MPELVRSLMGWRLAAIAGVTLAAAALLFWLATQATKTPMGLLFSGLDPRDSAAVVERPFVLTCRDGWPPLPITISAGVAGLMPDPGASAQSLAVALLERADAALLNAKRSGRNRLIVAGLDAAA